MLDYTHTGHILMGCPKSAVWNKAFVCEIKDDICIKKIKASDICNSRHSLLEHVQFIGYFHALIFFSRPFRRQFDGFNPPITSEPVRQSPSQAVRQRASQPPRQTVSQSPSQPVIASESVSHLVSH